MRTLTRHVSLTLEEVERASDRDAKHYELINGELKDRHPDHHTVIELTDPIFHAFCWKLTS